VAKKSHTNAPPAGFRVVIDIPHIHNKIPKEYTHAITEFLGEKRRWRRKITESNGVSKYFAPSHGISSAP
jgi:hypothetical protein